MVDATCKETATTAIFPHEPQRRWDEALAALAKLAREHRVELIAIGNGTASRETDKLATELVRLRPDIPVLLTTGHVEEFAQSELRAAGIREVLMKPVLLDDLAAGVVRALTPQG